MTTKNSNLTTQPGSPLSFKNWRHFYPRKYKKLSEEVRSSSPAGAARVSQISNQKNSKSFTISLVPTPKQNQIFPHQEKEQEEDTFQNQHDMTFQSNNTNNLSIPSNLKHNKNEINLKNNSHNSFNYDSTNTTTITAARPLSHNIGLINQNKIDQHIMSSKSLLDIKQNKRQSESKKNMKYTQPLNENFCSKNSLKFSTNPRIRNSFQEFNDELLKIIEPINDGFQLKLNSQFDHQKTQVGISQSLINSHICQAHDLEYQYYCNDKFLCKKCIRLLRGSNLLFGEKIYTIQQVAQQFQQRLKNEKLKIKKISIQDYCLKLQSTQTFLKQWYKKSRGYINEQFYILQQLIKLQKTKVLSQIQSLAQQQTALLRHNGSYLKDITQFLQNSKSPCLMSSPFSIVDQHKLSNLFSNFSQKLAIFRAKFHSIMDESCQVKSDLSYFNEVTKAIGKISLETKDQLLTGGTLNKYIKGAISSYSGDTINQKQNYGARPYNKKRSQQRRHVRVQSRYTGTIQSQSNNENSQNCTQSSSQERRSQVKIQVHSKPHLLSASKIGNKTPSPHNFFALRMQKMNQKWQRNSSTTNRTSSTTLPKTPQTGAIQTLSNRNQNIISFNKFKTPQPFYQSVLSNSGGKNNQKKLLHEQLTSSFYPQDKVTVSKIISSAIQSSSSSSSNNQANQLSRQPTFEDQKIYNHTRQSSKSFNSSDKLAALLFPNNSNTNPPSSRKQSISAYQSMSMLSNHSNNKFNSNLSQQYQKSISPNLFNVSITYPQQLAKRQNIAKMEIIDQFELNHMNDDYQNLILQSNNSDSCQSSQLFENPSLYFSPQVAPGSHKRKSTFGNNGSAERKNSRLRNVFDSRTVETGNFGDKNYNSLVKSAASKYAQPMNTFERDECSRPGISLFDLNDGSFQQTGKFNSRNASKNDGFPTFNDEDELIKSTQRRGLNKRTLLIRDKENSDKKLKVDLSVF